MRILSPPNAQISQIDEPIQMKGGFIAKPSRIRVKFLFLNSFDSSFGKTQPLFHWRLMADGFEFLWKDMQVLENNLPQGLLVDSHQLCSKSDTFSWAALKHSVFRMFSSVLMLVRRPTLQHCQRCFHKHYQFYKT